MTPAERTALIKAQTSLLDLINGAHKAYVAIGEVLVGGQPAQEIDKPSGDIRPAPSPYPPKPGPIRPIATAKEGS